MAVDPLEAVCLVILLPESRVLKVKLVQVFHETCKSLMDRIVEEHPVLFTLFIPFTELADLISHEVQFLARMCIHIHVQCACLREFVVIVAAHFLHDRCLAVDNLIV